MNRFDGVLQNAVGEAIAGADVYVCTQPAVTTNIPPSPLASLFADTGGVTPITNPVVTDGNGRFFFYAATGLYTLVYFDPFNRVATLVFPDQAIVTQGGGSVTSVTMTVPTGLAISGSPITSSGTLAITYSSDWPANTFIGGPASGSAAAPTRRTLVAADVAGLVAAVTSVNASVTPGSLFSGSFSGGPVTSTGTLALTFDLKNQNANLVLAGPSSGGLGAVTARSLVAADFPGVLLQTTTTALSSAQLLALLGTPVSLVPAPGVGFTIVPLMIVIEFFGGSAAYTDAGGAVSLNIGTASQALSTNAIFTTATSPNKQIQRINGFAATDTAGNPPTDDNGALTISKATNNFAAGNGTAKVLVHYLVLPTT